MIGGNTLSTDDAAKVMRILIAAQNDAKYIGLALEVPCHVYDHTYSRPRDHLFAVIMAYLKQIKPRPTWRAIANLLRDPIVNLPQLAQTIEEEYLLSSRIPPDRGTYLLEW